MASAAHSSAGTEGAFPSEVAWPALVEKRTRFDQHLAQFRRSYFPH
jgi:hypothetical protein